jgi:hypothetical protein
VFAQTDPRAFQIATTVAGLVSTYSRLGSQKSLVS